ncbi:costars family protein [Spizellomyces punctatus DAOM BR117]|uniref:Costars family protein n=1 Tax=Spizellomyces punctatus (strain DAOM BR117) TaxID=645134 RepID=A0A0L0HJ63_SPIPD|nr:costars family protein [Spizellomyces punctatus DAOM BR117]KND01506.1 costars family protein [Spizellomyces punctatus DAOM BR117]|eukprot:XP_016609545.1 costars family protein [Spizellomyces punctatus DAOM BR117]
MVNVDEEVDLLKREIKRLGTQDPSTGKTSVKFGKLVRDDECANIFEAIVGTLRAAKKRKIVAYDGEILLQGPHDNVDIVLL